MALEKALNPAAEDDDQADDDARVLRRIAQRELVAQRLQENVAHAATRTGADGACAPRNSPSSTVSRAFASFRWRSLTWP